VRPLASAALAAVLAIVLAGCAGAPPLPTYPPTTTPADALAVFARNHDGWRTLRAEVSGNSPRGSFGGALFVDRGGAQGGRLRLYAWKLGGAIAVFDLLVDAGEMRLLVPRAARILKRPLDAPGEGAAGFDGILAALLRSGAPAERRAARSPRGFEVEEREGGGKGALARWLLDPRTLAPLELATGGVTVELDEHRVVAGRVVPGRMRVRDRQGGEALRLELDDIVIDAPLEPKNFVMRLPPGTVEVHDMRALEGERGD
jgi:hypothetical protein